MEDGSSAQEDFTSLSLNDKLSHKHWKARQLGYDELTRKFRLLDAPNHPDYRKQADAVKKAVLESNAIALEAGLQATLAYITLSDQGTKLRKEVLSGLLEKSLASPRASTRQACNEIILALVECDTAEPVVEEVLLVLDNKLPKMVSFATATLTALLHAFGAKVIPVKSYVKVLSKLFAHSDKTVRAEATKLSVELYRWIGGALLSQLSDLKPVQLKELNELFEQLPKETAVPERYLRSQAASATALAGAPSSTAVSAAVSEPVPVVVDAYDLADPVDVLDKIPTEFYTLLASAQWKERKQALESLMPVIKTPKIADNRYGELISSLAKRLNDANILIVVLAAQAIEAMALGLRDAFSPYRSLVVTPLLERLKEKKANVIEALSNALDAVFRALPQLSPMLDEVSQQSQHKNPNVKLESLKWLKRCLEKYSGKGPTKAEIKIISELCIKALEDGVNEVREAAAECLGVVLKVVGERAMAQYLEKVDKLKQVKIREFADKAKGVVQSNVSIAAASNTSESVVAASVHPIKSKLSSAPVDPMDKENSPPAMPAKSTRPTLSATSSSSLKKKTIKKPNSQASSSASLAATNSASNASSSAVTVPALAIQYKYSNEGALSFFEEKLSPTHFQQFQSSQWKERIEALSQIEESLSLYESELVIRFLLQRPSFKEAHFQVQQKLIQLLEKCCTLPIGNPACVALIADKLVERLADNKLKTAATSCLSVCISTTNLGFVLEKSYQSMAMKQPKSLLNQLEWMQSVMEKEENVSSTVASGPFLSCLTELLQLTQPQVRQQVIALISSLPSTWPLKQWWSGLNLSGAVMQSIEKLIENKWIDNKALESKKMPSNNSISSNAEMTVSSASVKSSQEQLQDATVTDLSGVLNQKLLKQLSDPLWKQRKEAMDQLLQHLTSCSRMKPLAHQSEWTMELKNRLQDSNRVIAYLALECCQQFCQLQGRSFEKSVRVLIAPVLGCLTENKQPFRDAAVRVMDNMVRRVMQDKVEWMLPSAATVLMHDHAVQRRIILQFLVDLAKESKEKEITPSNANNGTEWQQMIQPLLQCLQDRLPEVRRAAQALVPVLVQKVGNAAWQQALNDLKRAVWGQVMPLIESAMKEAGIENAGNAVVNDGPNEFVEEVLQEKNETTVEIAASTTATTTDPPLNQSKKLFSLDLDQLAMPSVSTKHLDLNLPVNNNAPAIETTATSLLTAPTPQLPSRQSNLLTTRNAPSMDYLMAQVMSGNVKQSIDALKQLEIILSHPSQESQFRQHVPGLIHSMTLQMKLVFIQLQQQQQGESSLNTPSLPGWNHEEKGNLFRLCKHLINSLVTLFSKVDNVAQLQQETMQPLLQEILNRLLEQESLGQGASNEEQTQPSPAQSIVRALNILMIRVLENAPQVLCYRLLLEMLVEMTLSWNAAFVMTATSSNVPPSQASKLKAGELVMKCLWKMTKNLRQQLERISTPSLLDACDAFFRAMPPSVWKQRAAKQWPLGDMPLRTVKTILHELVVALGERVLENCALPESSQVMIYLRFMLEGNGNKQMALLSPPPKTTTMSQGSEESKLESDSQSVSNTSNTRASNNVAAPTPLTEQAVHANMTRIIARIGAKQETKQGLEELYDFQLQHAYAKEWMDRYLEKMSAFFQNYVRRGLQNVAEERSAGLGSNTTTAAKSNSNSSASSSQLQQPKALDPAKAYMERLLQIQQMYGIKSTSVNKEELSNVPVSPSTVTNTNMNSIPNLNPLASPSVSLSSETKTSLIPSSLDKGGASVADIKERLARLKEMTLK